MRNLIQGSIKITPVVANAKFLVVVGRKVETVWFPHNLSEKEVRKILVERQEITLDDKVIRG